MPALDGMRILDMTQYEAGPSCTQALAWLGADVVKVERPEGGDPGRNNLSGDPNQSEYFSYWNSNKRSITINLKSPEGHEILMNMIPKYDVFIENYAPGVADKLKLDYETLKAVHPGIIYASVKGFGDSGPYSHYKCYDMVSQAASGAISVTGEPDGPPIRPGLTIGDSGTGMQLALGITAAYVEKQRTGLGQRIDISMHEAMTYYMRTAISMGGTWNEEPAPRIGNSLNAVINMFPCKPFGPNDYVYIMAATDLMWVDLCHVIERPDILEDPRYVDRLARMDNKESLVEEITKWTREHTKQEAMKIVGDAGVPASAVFDTLELYNDPHLNARGFVQTIDHDVFGEKKMLGAPIRMSSGSVKLKAAPSLGRHTDEVLAQDLDLDEEKIKGLREAGVLGTHPMPTPSAP